MKTGFENIFDSYCPMLHSIALQVCKSESQAERILMITFKKVFRQNIRGSNSRSFCIDLIKLIIQTAQEELYPGETKCNFRIKQFENSPLLHTLLVEQLSLEDYCFENNTSRSNALLNLRKDFNIIREVYGVSPIEANVRSFTLN